MVDTARLLAGARVSFVVESSVLSPELVGALRAQDARVLAVHVVAHEHVTGERLRARAVDGRPVDRQLAALFRRGVMRRSVFEPPAGVDAVVTVDASDHREPAIDPIETALVDLLR